LSRSARIATQPCLGSPYESLENARRQIARDFTITHRTVPPPDNNVIHASRPAIGYASAVTGRDAESGASAHDPGCGHYPVEAHPDEGCAGRG